MSSHPRLTLFTGKGGVGKSTLSLAYAKQLKEKKLNVVYTSFSDNPPEELLKKMDLPFLTFKTETSTTIYLTRILKTKMVAHWIANSSFFQSLVSIVPSITSIIFMGHLIDIMKKDPTLHVVLDSPASGHSISMLQVPTKFKNIIKSGSLFKDIQEINDIILNSAFTKINIVSLPNHISLEESKELKEALQSLNFQIYNSLLIIFFIKILLLIQKIL